MTNEHLTLVEFKEILTFVGINYLDASLITLYLVVIGISIPKSDELDNFNTQKFVAKKSNKSACFKCTYGLSGNDYRVVALSK